MLTLAKVIVYSIVIIVRRAGIALQQRQSSIILQGERALQREKTEQEWNRIGKKSLTFAGKLRLAIILSPVRLSSSYHTVSLPCRSRRYVSTRSSLKPSVFDGMALPHTPEVKPRRPRMTMGIAESILIRNKRRDVRAFDWQSVSLEQVE